MKIRLLLLAAFLLGSAGVFAQKAPTWKEIQNNPDYIYGVGRDAKLDRASKLALEELVSSICTSVDSKFEYTMSQTEVNGDIQFNSDVNSIVNSYSKMTLRGAKTLRLTTDKDKEQTVVRYITTQDLEDMFAKRRQKATEYVYSGNKAKAKGNIGTAIQYYFWSLALANSAPDAEKFSIRDMEGTERQFVTWLPDLLREALSQIKVSVNEIEKDEDLKILTLDVEYDGKPAGDLSFTCTDGEYVSDIITAKSGNCIIELPEAVKEKKLTLNIDYRGEDEAKRDAELSEVIDALSDMTFKNATISLARDIRKKQKSTFAETEYAVQETVAMAPATSSVASVAESMVHYLNADEAQKYIPVAQKIEEALRKRDFAKLESISTPDGWDMIQKLLSYGSARLIGYPNIQFLDNNGDITMRSFPMQFTFKSNNHRKFTEDVVFHLNAEGQITQVAFALEKRAADDILCHRGNWSDRSKQTIINFMETYKTAFALKDLDYIDRIFSDDALIITGRVVKPSGKKSEIQPNDLSKVQYIKQSKAEYIKNLERTFGANEYVNLKFADTMVKKGGYKNHQTGEPKEVYGIQLKQDYYSQTYGDTGYLFLAVDLDNPEQPVIHIRTWQPEADGANNGVFGIEDFN